MKKDSHTIEMKDSIRRKLSTYSKRTAFTLIFTLLFSFVISFTIVYYNFRNIGYNYWFKMSILVIWWIFGILLGISAIFTFVYFILFLTNLKKLSQLNYKYSNKLDYLVLLVFCGIIFCFNSFFFIHLRAFDKYFLYPRILSLIGLICLSFGLYKIYKFFASLKSAKVKNENLLVSRFLYYSVLAFPIVVIIDIVIRVIFKNTLFGTYCSPYICNRYPNNQFYIAANSWNFALIFMIVSFTTIAILGLFKVSKYIQELDDSIEEEFKKKPEVSLMSKLSKNIRFSTYSLSFTILSLILLHSLYGDFIWNVSISFNSSISYMFWAQFIFQAVISAIFFSIFFVRFILNLRKLSSMNIQLSKLTKRSSLILIFGLILLFTGYVAGLFNFYEKAIYYISNSIKLLSFLLLFFGFLMISLMFGSLKKKEMYSGRLIRTSPLYAISFLFMILIIIDTIIRTHIFSSFEIYTTKYYEALEINNTFILILVAILTVSFSFSMYLLSKEFKRISLKKIQIQKIKKIRTIEETTSIYSKNFAYSAISSLIFAILIVLINFKPRNEIIEFDGINIVPSILLTIAGISLVVFFILNFSSFFKMFQENKLSKKRNIISLVLLIGSLALILASIASVYDYGYYQVDEPTFYITRSIIVLALVFLSIGYIIFLRVLESLNLYRRRLIILPISSFFLSVVVLADLLGKSIAWNKAEDMHYFIRRLFYEESVKWLFIFDMILIPLLIIVHIIGYFFLSKDILLFTSITRKNKE